MKTKKTQGTSSVHLSNKYLLSSYYVIHHSGHEEYGSEQDRQVPGAYAKTLKSQVRKYLRSLQTRPTLRTCPSCFSFGLSLSRSLVYAYTPSTMGALPPPQAGALSRTLQLAPLSTLLASLPTQPPQRPRPGSQQSIECTGRMCRFYYRHKIEGCLAGSARSESMTWDRRKQAGPILTWPELPGPSASATMTAQLASLPEASGGGPQGMPLLASTSLLPSLPTRPPAPRPEPPARGACGWGRGEAHPRH